MEITQVLVRPIVTEKSNRLMIEGKYTFEVATRASKPEIRQAVETLFEVEVTRVTTMRIKGKYRRQGKTGGYRSDWKKAIVQLKPGSSIQLYEGV